MSRFPLNAEDKQIAASMDGLLRLVEDAGRWCATHRPQDLALKSGFSDLQRRASQAARAAGRPLTVALFGESQVGKSFLLAGLCGGEGGNIRVRRPSGDCAGAEWASHEGIGFLEYINQEAKGQRETTGLVTRFSTSPHLSPRTSGTFVATIVSHSDLIDMLATGFRAECTGYEDVESRHIDALLENLRKTTRPVDESRRQALVRALDLSASIPQLANSYQRALDGSALRTFLRELSGDLEAADWHRLAGVFWGMGRFPALDAYYARVYSVLERLRFAPVIEVPWQVVCRAGRADDLKSVTSIEALESLFSGDESRLTEVSFQASDEQVLRTRLTIGEISAVTAELILPVLAANGGKSLLDQADLLDFPGSVPHSGTSAPGPANFQSGAEAFARASYVFRRGKLARLFENYCEARDITVLLQCADERNPTAMLMPGQIVRWLRSRYPGYPTLPAGEHESPSLFFVRTKADLLFKPRIAQIDTGESATGEFIKAQVQFFERALPEEHRWFSSWGGARPFDNLYFVFRPQLFARSVQTADNIRQELRLYEASEWVARHVRNKAARWAAFVPPVDEGRSGGDGGVSFLVARVADKVEPRLKREELAAEHGILVQEFSQLLPPPVASDIAERRRQAALAAQLILDELKDVEAENSFGRLLLRLSLPERLAAKALSGRGDVVDTLSRAWIEHILADHASPSPVRNLGRLAQELDRFKRREFRGVLDAPAFRFLAGSSSVAPVVAARVVARLWNRMHVDLGVPVPICGLPEIPVRIGADARPARRLFVHWESRLPQVFQDNASEGAALPPGNDELAALAARLNRGSSS